MSIDTTTNLLMLIEETGEDATEGMLSCFSSPMNPDVERFLKRNAIDFAKQRKSQTHLVIQLVNGNLLSWDIILW